MNAPASPSPTLSVETWMRRLQRAFQEGAAAYEAGMQRVLKPYTWEWETRWQSSWSFGRRRTRKTVRRDKRPWEEVVTDLLAHPPAFGPRQLERLATHAPTGARLQPGAWHAFLVRLGGDALAQRWRQALVEELDQRSPTGRLTWWALDRLQQEGQAFTADELRPLWATPHPNTGTGVLVPRPIGTAWAFYAGLADTMPREQLLARWIALFARPVPTLHQRHDYRQTNEDLLRLRQLRSSPDVLTDWEVHLLLNALAGGPLSPDLQETLLRGLETADRPIASTLPGPARDRWLGSALAGARLIEHTPLADRHDSRRPSGPWALACETPPTSIMERFGSIPLAWLQFAPERWGERLPHWLPAKDPGHASTVVSLLLSNLGDLPTPDGPAATQVPVAVLVPLIQRGDPSALRIDGRMFTGFSVPWTQAHPHLQRALLLHPDRTVRTNFIRLMGLQPTHVVDTRFIDRRPDDEAGRTR